MSNIDILLNKAILSFMRDDATLKDVVDELAIELEIDEIEQKSNIDIATELQSLNVSYLAGEIDELKRDEQLKIKIIDAMLYVADLGNGNDEPQEAITQPQTTTL